MILLLMILLSLSAVYFTRLLQRNGMKTAAVTVAVLYLYLIAWTYAVFILDIADLGFAERETQVSLLHGSDIYHSFVQLTAKMAAIPFELLEAIVGVAVLVLIAGFSVAFHGVFEISIEIYKTVCKNYIEKNKTVMRKAVPVQKPVKTVSLIRLNCRANC